MTRHNWSEPVRFQHKTERECVKCGMVKVTRHENDLCWVEFWRGLDQVNADRTPPCEITRQ